MLALTDELSELFTHLDHNLVALEEFGYFVALSGDRKTIFACPMSLDGSPEQYEDDPRHMNWIEVTAPEPEFLNKVNELFRTSFQMERFAGR